MTKTIRLCWQILLPLFLASILTLAGCTQSQQSAPAAPITPAPAPSQPPVTAAPAPAVKIIQPAAGVSLPPGSISVIIETSNFEAVAPGGANVAGTGHIHYYLDVDIPTASGMTTFTAPGTYKATAATSVTWDNVAAGTHTLGVQLVNANHTPLSPPVTAKVTITVTAPATTTAAPSPTVKIIQPAAGVALLPGSISVMVELSNFEGVAPGSANIAGKGHIHYYLDAAIPKTAGQPAFSAVGTYKATVATSVTWDNVAAGTHTLGVQLVNSDHTPLSPPVTAQMTITVTAPATTTAAPAPAVKIIQPAAGVSLPPGSISVIIETSNFEAVAPGGANVAGTGHIHYYLDVDIPTASGMTTFTAPGTYKATAATSVTWDNVAAGTHTLGVQLVNANHTPLSPPVTAKMTITVAVANGGGGGVYSY